MTLAFFTGVSFCRFAAVLVFANEGYARLLAQPKTQLPVISHAYGATVDCGAVVLFARTADGWERKQTLRGVVPGSFGSALVITDNLLVVGAPEERIEEESDMGAVYLFALTGDRWKGSEKIVGRDPFGTNLFGAALFVENRKGVLTVGAIATPYGLNADGMQGGGAVYLFDLRGNPISEKIVPSFIGWGAQFGKAL